MPVLNNKPELYTALGHVPRPPVSDRSVKRFVDLLDDALVAAAAASGAGVAFPGDLAYVIPATGIHVVFTSVALTANHNWNLPLSSAFGAGEWLLLAGVAGRVGTYWIQIVADIGPPANTINGAASIFLTQQYAAVLLAPNGVTGWTIAGSHLFTADTGSPRWSLVAQP